MYSMIANISSHTCGSFRIEYKLQYRLFVIAINPYFGRPTCAVDPWRLRAQNFSISDKDNRVTDTNYSESYMLYNAAHPTPSPIRPSCSLMMWAHFKTCIW